MRSARLFKIPFGSDDYQGLLTKFDNWFVGCRGKRKSESRGRGVLQPFDQRAARSRNPAMGGAVPLGLTPSVTRLARRLDEPRNCVSNSWI